MNRSDQSFRLDHEFEQQAWRTPTATALHYEGASITFSELKARVDRVLTSLRALGIRDARFIGVHMERSINYVVSVLAILKANSAVVPLPPSYPESRLREIISFAVLDAVIAGNQTPLGPGVAGKTIVFSDAMRGAATSTSMPTPPGDPNQPAFVLCSSGSTGAPKLIVRSHRSFFHRLRWTWDDHPYAIGEVCCQKSHMATTHAIYELFEPLLRGVPIHVIADEQVKRLEPLWKTIHTQAISRLLIVPSLLQASLDMPGFVAPPLKTLVLMGEHVTTKLAARAIAAFPKHTEIFSIYGSTEASSTFVCDIRRQFRPGQELPLGKPIAADVRAVVLGSDLAPVSAGETGILHIAGSPLFTEYFRDAESTAAAFSTLPVTGETLYNTHDQVLRTTNGNLHFVGRIDDTVKIRGFRVDLKEVERTLMRHPDVRQSTVIASNDKPGQAMLLAFVIPETVAQPELRHLLRQHLPSHMIPPVIVCVPALPLTASGKVDRQRLLAEHADRVANGVGAFASDTARRVAEIWGQVLRCTDIGPDSSFFEIGGNSLNEFTAVHHLRDAFGLDRHQLPEVSIHQFQTVAALAACIDAIGKGTPPAISPSNAILSTLKHGDHALPPVFAIASAGGTLGAYDKLVRSIDIRREIIGVRDPFLWNARDPTANFQSWVALYVNAIRERQARGPYYLLAYSSAGAFGCEIAQHLRRSGEEVALLALIDPLAMDRSSKRRFGYWALQARFMSRLPARIVMLAGLWLRLAVPHLLRGGGRSGPADDPGLSQEQFAQAATRSLTSREHMLALSVLLELNSGLPFALSASELSQVAPANYLDRLLERAKNAAPEVNREMIENIAVQYNLQVHAHHRYRLRRYDAKVVIFDTKGPCSGLLAAQFRPYIDDLDVREIALGKPSARTLALARIFPENIRSHYLSMRDETFVHTLAGELTGLLS